MPQKPALSAVRAFHPHMNKGTSSPLCALLGGFLGARTRDLAVLDRTSLISRAGKPKAAMHKDIKKSPLASQSKEPGKHADAWRWAL